MQSLSCPCHSLEHGQTISRSRVAYADLHNLFVSASGHSKLNIVRVTRVAKLLILLMGMVGIEPTRPCGHRFLRPARLPVPPRPRLFNDRKIGRIDFTSGRDYMSLFQDGQAATLPISVAESFGLRRCGYFNQRLPSRELQSWPWTVKVSSRPSVTTSL